MHAIAGTLIPLFLCAMLTRFYGERRSAREGLEAWPFALFAAFAFTVPYLACAVVLGPEFPSLIGGATGMAIVIAAVRRGWFVPARPGTSRRAPSGTGVDGHARRGRRAAAAGSRHRAWAPYASSPALLLATRLPWLGIGARLAAIDIGPREHPRQRHRPGDPAVLPARVHVHRRVRDHVWASPDVAAEIASRGAARRGQLRGAAVALVFALPMVRVFIESGPRFNASGLESMPITLAHAAADRPAARGRSSPRGSARSARSRPAATRCRT
jgi:lactate permease